MARVLVLQHVAAEPLGLLDPMLRRQGHRIRYVNFARQPDYQPRLDRYHALIVLGGPMQIGQSRRYPHLDVECRLIEQAFKRDVPVLGICLGAQLMAHVLGGRVGPAERAEIGWYRIEPTKQAAADRVMSAWQRSHPVFQWHHWGFDCPPDALELATHADSGCQAFATGQSAWGFQFHLELDQRLIHRWLSLPFYLEDLASSGLDVEPEHIRRETTEHLPNTLQLADQVFGNWLELLTSPEQRLVVPSR